MTDDMMPMDDMYFYGRTFCHSHYDMVLRSRIQDAYLYDLRTAVSIITCNVPMIEELTDSLFLERKGKPSAPTGDLGAYAAWADRIEEWRPGTLTARIVQALVMGKADLVRSYKAQPCRTLSGMVYEGIDFKGHPNRAVTPKCTVRRGIKHTQFRRIHGGEPYHSDPCWWLSITASWYKGGGTPYENRNRCVRIVTHDMMGIDHGELKLHISPHKEYVDPVQHQSQ